VGLPPVLWSFPPTTAFISYPAPDCWTCAAGPAGQRVCLQLKWKVGLPPSPVEFFSLLRFYKLSRSWLLGVCRHSCLLRPGLFIYLQFQEGFPSPSLGFQGTPPSLLHVFIVLIAYYSVSLFSLGGGWSVQRAMLIWPRVVCGSTTCRLAHLVVPVFPSLLGAGLWWQPGALLVSPFSVNWRWSVQAGGVEGSKFCLFSVVLSVRCVSSVSPRFYFRRHAFCFLLLAAILESLSDL
jgi:hypothetical protein